MPPENTINNPNVKEEFPSKKKNFWLYVFIVGFVIFVVVILFISNRGFRGYSDEEMGEFLNTTGVSEEQIYTNEEIENFNGTTEVSNQQRFYEEDTEKFLNTTEVIN